MVEAESFPEISEGIRQDGLKESLKRNALIIYPKDLSYELEIRIQTREGGIRFFSAVGKQSVEDPLEDKEEMVVKGKRPTFKKVLKRIRPFLKKFYPEVAKLPIYLVEKTR